MKRLLSTSTIAALLLGCASSQIPTPPADLPLRYHNAPYDFIFFLPAGWRGYSVLIQSWEGQSYSAAQDKIVVTDRGPAIVLRHPLWQEAAPSQDIPIQVFTRGQWEAEKAGKFFIGAGGVEEEIEHNRQYVFAIHSRFNWGELTGWQEAGRIVERNSAANEPRLHPE